jgi:hypothetical protein
VCYADTEDLASKETYIIHDKSRQSGLFDNVSPAVHSCGTGDFGPDNEDQGDIVDPSVDSVEEVVAEFSAVWKAHEKTDYGEDSDDYRT